MGRMKRGVGDLVTCESGVKAALEILAPPGRYPVECRDGWGTGSAGAAPCGTRVGGLGLDLARTLR